MIPIAVPTSQVTVSTRQAASVRPGQCAGTIVVVAEPTERMPIDTVPHIGVWVESRSVIENASRESEIRTM